MDCSKWKIGVKVCGTRDKVLIVIRKNGYTYMFRVNDKFIISKEKVRCSETRNLSANKNFLAFIRSSNSSTSWVMFSSGSYPERRKYNIHLNITFAYNYF